MTGIATERFERVKGFLLELGLRVVREDAEEHLVIVSDEDEGIVNLIVDCEDDIVLLEQHILNLAEEVEAGKLRRLLEINRGLVHGALALDGEGRLLFRDTLRLDTLDFEELAASIQALSFAMGEFGPELLRYAPAHA